MKTRRKLRALTVSFAMATALAGCTTKAEPLPDDWWQAYPEEECNFSRDYLPAIQSQPYYIGNRNGAVDPVAHRKAMDASRPLRNLLSRNLDTQRRVEAGNAKSVICAERELAFWARNNALLGNNTNRGFYERIWYAAGLGIAYANNSRLLASQGQRRPVQTDRIVTDWFNRLAHDTRRAMEADRAAFDPSMARQSYRPPEEHDTGNLGAWAAYFAIIAGILSEDPELLAWGRDRTEMMLATVDRYGMLPSEVARANRALHYHFFALNPLVGSAILLERAGEPLPGRSHDALRSLVRFSLRETRNPVAIMQAAGVRSIQNPAENETRERLMLGPALYCAYIDRDLPECDLVPRSDSLNFPYMGGTTGEWALATEELTRSGR